MRFYTKNITPRNDFDYLDKFLADFLAYHTTVHSKNSLNADIYENDKAYFLIVGDGTEYNKLPGFKKEDVSVELDNGYLIINAKKEPNDEDVKYLCRQRFSGQIRRSYYVGKNVSFEDVSASLADGLLKIAINKPKTESQSSKLITIN